MIRKCLLIKRGFNLKQKSRFDRGRVDVKAVSPDSSNLLLSVWSSHRPSFGRRFFVVELRAQDRRNWGSRGWDRPPTRLKSISNGLLLLKVRKSRKQLIVSSILPKKERKNDKKKWPTGPPVKFIMFFIRFLEDRKRNRQTITVSTLRFKRLTTVLPYFAFKIFWPLLAPQIFKPS